MRRANTSDPLRMILRRPSQVYRRGVCGAAAHLFDAAHRHRRRTTRSVRGGRVRARRFEDLLERQIARADHAAVVAENRRFHQTVNRIAENVDALPIVDKHWLLLVALWRNFGYGAARFAGVANDHRHLITALAAHDQEAASLIMGAHATKAKLDLLARIASQSAEHVKERRRA